MNDLTPKGFSNGQYVDRFLLRDKLYAEDAATMKGVAILNEFPAADVVERPRWVPVEERLPENSASVLVCDCFGEITIGYRHHVIVGGIKYPESWEVFDDLEGAITHWMPLPEPPKEES